MDGESASETRVWKLQDQMIWVETKQRSPESLSDGTHLGKRLLATLAS